MKLTSDDENQHTRNLELKFWKNARQIVHFIGICGAGKTTMSARIVNRCSRMEAAAFGTADGGPHLTDNDRKVEQAFRRDLDLEMIADPSNPDIHRKIRDHSLEVIAKWQKAPANLRVVDRFVESYDYLPKTYINEIQIALAQSGFSVLQVLLVIGLDSNHHKSIVARLLQTKTHRPSHWWQSGPDDAEQFGADEVLCQEAYRRYCATSPFDTAIIDTSAMDWAKYEQAIVDQLMLTADPANRQWTDSMKHHSTNTWPITARSSRQGMFRPGFDWFATMCGTPANIHAE